MERNRFTDPKFEGVEFILESSESPKIKTGGSSSSNVINRYLQSLSEDVALLTTRTNLLARRAQRISLGMTAQSGALLSMLQAVSGAVTAASGNQVLASLYTNFFVDAATTATISNLFGQATLPMNGLTDLLVQRDVYNNPYISPEIEFSYATGTSPTLLDFVVDPEANFMITDEQMWIQDATSADTWCIVKCPVQFRGMAPNLLEVYPFPAFGMDLVEVAVQLAGSQISSSWVPLDLSYLPNYNASTTLVESVGPIRLHLSNVSVSQIRLHFRPRSNTVWGLAGFKLYHADYDSSASLVVKNPWNTMSVTNAVLRGKDSSVLSQLTTARSGEKLTINLTSSDTGYTPVITGAILSFV